MAGLTKILAFAAAAQTCDAVRKSAKAETQEMADANAEQWADANAEQLAELNATSGWTPCLRGMCYRGWGSNQVSGATGTGGLGNSGCRKLFGGCGRSRSMPCTFGACPKHFQTKANVCVSSRDCRSYCDVSGSCRYNGPIDGQSYSRWMQEFADKPFNQLLMVEAHHVLSPLGSLDFKKPVKPGERILGQLARWTWIPGFSSIMDIAYQSLLPMLSSTQSSDTRALLRSGVRGFDLRPYLSKRSNTLRDQHGGQGPEVEPAFAAIASFLRSNPSEVVVIQIKNILTAGSNCLECASGNVYEEIDRVLQRNFKGCSTSGGMVACNANLGDSVRSFGGRVIIHSNNNNLHGRADYIHNSDRMYRARWYNKNNLDELKREVLNDADAQRLSRRDDFLIGHQWVLSPTTNDFLGAVTQRHTGNYQGQANTHGCQSLACFAEVASARSFLASWREIKAKYARTNFIMLDFADRAGGMDVVLAINRER